MSLFLITMQNCLLMLQDAKIMQSTERDLTSFQSIQSTGQKNGKSHLCALKSQMMPEYVTQTLAIPQSICDWASMLPRLDSCTTTSGHL